MRPSPPPLVTISRDVLGGEPVFAGTRVPIRALLDHLEAGDTVEKFLVSFPTVPREMAIRFLEESAEALLAGVAAH